MEFLNKIEDFINTLLVKIGQWIIHTILRITPKKILRLFTNFKETTVQIKLFLKNLPKNFVQWAIIFLKSTKEKVLSIDFKEKINTQINKIKESYNEIKNSKDSKIKKFVLIPKQVISNWVKGLTPSQTILFITSITGSLLAFISIISTSNRILNITRQGRSPASVVEEEKSQYERPDYYKKEKRHVLFSSVRLPVYSADPKELQTVEIDFNVTLSNRHARNLLEKFEFQLRDYLILKLEPQIAEFPLQEEGKEILRDKISQEIDLFLKERNINGQVTEVKIIYVLAN